MSALYQRTSEVHYVAKSADQRRREPEVTRCRVIHHGLDASRYPYAWSERPDEYVCFVGRLAPEKGAHTAIPPAVRA